VQRVIFYAISPFTDKALRTKTEKREILKMKTALKWKLKNPGQIATFAGRATGLFCAVGAVGALSAAPALAQDWGTLDKLRDFVSRTEVEQLPVLTNASEIEKRSLMETSLRTPPWSSTYWPDMEGSVAYPYAEHHLVIPFMPLLSWDYTRSVIGTREELHADIAQGKGQVDDSTIANLSPAEKYDLLLGDDNFTFTHAIRSRVDQLSHLGLLNLKSLWSGICHGWSPASLYMPRPVHVFTATAPNGRKIPFYPSDVKALESMAWGDAFGAGGAQYYAKVEGMRCMSGGHTDKFGRLTDPNCFDVNPAFLHLVMVNQLGLNQRGFVMDRALKDAVQNQPVFAYRLKYYQIGKRGRTLGQTLEQAKQAFTPDSRDFYRKYRSPRTKALVGVEAKVWYGDDAGVLPNHNETDDLSHDQHKTYTMHYDLELDENNEIVGGEWREYDNELAQTLVEQIEYRHPDLIWLIPPTVKPFSLGDWDILKEQWNGTDAVPSTFLAAAAKSSAWTERQTMGDRTVDKMYPQPLLKVVEGLVARSRE
jgi:hypothetical protein